jgi:quercetin dioxygenase-like cupin family protein
MKNLFISAFVLLPLFIYVQNSEYTINSYFDEGVKAPNTHYIGDAWLNFLLQANDDFKYNITQAIFSPNSTLDWHKHSTAQVIIIVEGEG